MRATSLRSVDVTPVRVPVPVAISPSERSAEYARSGARAVVGAMAFLSSYALLQILHATGHDPAFARALSPIPLFARFLAGVAIAAPVGLVGGALIAPRPRLLTRLPRALAATIAAFVTAVVLFP
jgi:hypothetical protein